MTDRTVAELDPMHIDAPTHRAHVRSPVDVLRLIVGLAMILLGVAIANLFDSTLLGLAEDGAELIDELPAWTRDIPAAVLAVAVIAVAAGALAASLITTRYRRSVMLAVGFVAAAGTQPAARRTDLLRGRRVGPAGLRHHSRHVPVSRTRRPRRARRPLAGGCGGDGRRRQLVLRPNGHLATRDLPGALCRDLDLDVRCSRTRTDRRRRCRRGRVVGGAVAVRSTRSRARCARDRRCVGLDRSRADGDRADRRRCPRFGPVDGDDPIGRATLREGARPRRTQRRPAVSRLSMDTTPQDR